ncbi:ankyrin repeat domain-containing protein [Flavobacterium sp.]|uniref:ankyrin repeat domain-containing protein n=1 Tax=Flavobacterium sp. TaxID=239 RepID=UPI002B4B2F4D|nr:ankyrin repeat domain-containing protein [Flavobacterium sp.]HLF51332.1 ankyrin repeat domain-containing protein [Flavobacterium sp.]
MISFSLFANAQDKNVFDVARKGTLEEMKSIYKSNPDLINTLSDDYTPLILACYRANVAVALFLINKVSDINYSSGDGTALMAAVMSGNIQIIDQLILHKANLNTADAQGKTALIYAAYFNKTEIVKSLIKAGVDKKHKDSEGKTALDFANFNKNTELIILLDN